MSWVLHLRTMYEPKTWKRVYRLPVVLPVRNGSFHCFHARARAIYLKRGSTIYLPWNDESSFNEMTVT
jgi:hypothetical protein